MAGVEGWTDGLGLETPSAQRTRWHRDLLKRDGGTSGNWERGEGGEEEAHDLSSGQMWT